LPGGTEGKGSPFLRLDRLTILKWDEVVDRPYVVFEGDGPGPTPTSPAVGAKRDLLDIGSGNPTRVASVGC
jgi:hypothetical protein